MFLSFLLGRPERDLTPHALAADAARVAVGWVRLRRFAHFRLDRDAPVHVREFMRLIYILLEPHLECPLRDEVLQLAHEIVDRALGYVQKRLGAVGGLFPRRYSIRLPRVSGRAGGRVFRAYLYAEILQLLQDVDERSSYPTLVLTKRLDQVGDALKMVSPHQPPTPKSSYRLDLIQKAVNLPRHSISHVAGKLDVPETRVELKLHWHGRVLELCQYRVPNVAWSGGSVVSEHIRLEDGSCEGARADLAVVGGPYKVLATC